MPASKDNNMQRVKLRDFSQSLPMALLRGREAIMRHFRSILREHDLTEQQWRILRALNAVEESEVTTLANTTFLLGPSLSRILKDLESRSLIARRTPENDQRRNIVSITKSGMELMDVAGAQSEAVYQQITKKIGKENYVSLLSMLKELETVMQAEEEAGD